MEVDNIAPVLKLDTREKKWRDIVPILDHLKVPYERIALDAGDYGMDNLSPPPLFDVLVARTTVADLYM